MSCASAKMMVRDPMKNSVRNVYLFPYVIWIGLFVVAPILLILYYSFFDIDGNWTFANYKTFFTPIYLKN